MAEPDDPYAEFLDEEENTDIEEVENGEEGEEGDDAADLSDNSDSDGFAARQPQARRPAGPSTAGLDPFLSPRKQRRQSAASASSSACQKRPPGKDMVRDQNQGDGQSYLPLQVPAAVLCSRYGAPNNDVPHGTWQGWKVIKHGGAVEESALDDLIVKYGEKKAAGRGFTLIHAGG